MLTVDKLEWWGFYCFAVIFQNFCNVDFFYRKTKNTFLKTKVPKKKDLKTIFTMDASIYLGMHRKTRRA